MCSMNFITLSLANCAFFSKIISADLFTHSSFRRTFIRPLKRMIS